MTTRCSEHFGSGARRNKPNKITKGIQQKWHRSNLLTNCVRAQGLTELFKSQLTDKRMVAGIRAEAVPTMSSSAPATAPPEGCFTSFCTRGSLFLPLRKFVFLLAACLLFHRER